MDQFEKFWSGGATTSAESQGFKYIEQEEYMENLKSSNNLPENTDNAVNYLSDAFMKVMDEIKYQDNVIDFDEHFDFNQFSYENLHKKS